MSEKGEVDCDSLVWKSKDLISKDLISVYEYLNIRCEGDEARLFSVVCSNRTKGNRHKELEIHNWIFYFKGVQKLEQLSREVVKSPSMEIFKTQLDLVLNSLI